MPEEVKLMVNDKLDYLVTSRPTAVNLADASRKLKNVVAETTNRENATGKEVAEAYMQAAEKMMTDDVADNMAIGKHGAEWLFQNTEAGRSGKEFSLLTHCNTG